MDYIDKNFIPNRTFWHAMTTPLKCPKCGYNFNGFFPTWKLLNAPIEAFCNKCSHEWSIAIPLGECGERQRILDLLEAEKRFYRLRTELADTVDLLHGK